MESNNTFLQIVACPCCRKTLSVCAVDPLRLSCSEHDFPCIDGIWRLLPSHSDGHLDPTTRQVADFYDRVGWIKKGGVYFDTIKYVDQRRLIEKYVRSANRRIISRIPRGGTLVEFGCGAGTWSEYRQLYRDFTNVIFVDVSIRALSELREKLGCQYTYVQGDLSFPPIRPGTADVVLAAHVLYHLNERAQLRSIREISTVLKHEGEAHVVYKWPSTLVATLTRFCKLIGNGGTQESEMPRNKDNPYYFSIGGDIISQEIDNCSIDVVSGRIFDHRFTKKFVDNGILGRIIIGCAIALEFCFPVWAGWRAPIGWSGLIVSASWASGPW